MIHSLIEAEWARECRRLFEAAIAEHNAAFPATPYQIAWGYRDLGTAQAYPERQDGRLRVSDVDEHEIRIGLHEGAETGKQPTCALTLNTGTMAHLFILPQNVEPLYTFLATVPPGVSLRLVPGIDPPRILVTGVETIIDVANLTAASLWVAIDRLNEAECVLLEQLVDAAGVCRDLWEHDIPQTGTP